MLSLLLLEEFPWIAACAGVEALGVAAAALCFAVHATDGETLTLADGRVHLRCQAGLRIQDHEWSAHLVRLERLRAPRRGLVLWARGQPHRVGRHLNPLQLEAVARELEAALRRAAAGQ